MSTEKFRVGLVQMSMRAGPEREPGKGHLADARGGRTRRADRVSAGAVPFAVFLPGRKRRAVCSGRADSGTDHGDAGPAGARARHRHHRIALRAAQRGSLSQHGRGDWRRRRDRRHLSQDAYSRRSAVFRKVLFHARRSGLFELRYALRPPGRAGLLGSVVSGSGARFRASRARTFSFIPLPSAGILRKKRSTALRSWMRGEPFSGRTPSRTAFTSRR